MAVYHDAYLFRLDAFEREVAPYAEALRNSDAEYVLLRTRALELFEGSAEVRQISAQRGGWNYAELLTFPAEQPYTAHDMAFWMVILLYGSLYRIGELGLGSERNLKQILQELGWSEQDIQLVSHGKSFAEFAAERLQADDEYWCYVHPSSTSSWAGWLSLEDAIRLGDMLARDEDRLAAILLPAKNDSTAEAIRSVYQKAKEMLGAAIEAECDLAMIISG